MKKSYLKWSILGLSMVLILNSCVQEETSPVAVEEKAVVESINELVAGSENFRKAPNGVVYQEKFSNQSIAGSNGIPPYAFPGFGMGNATYLGKSYSFFNQYATGEPDENGVVYTIAAPVTEFFAPQLTALGLDVAGINSNPKLVSTLTTDGKGNTIYFNNILNKAQFDLEGNISFEAQIEIVGGTGIFVDATGTGTVFGNVSGANGQGTTLVKAQIQFNK
ncbi:hypothetical protein DFQ04_1043 [Algoriphagus boseongensis]|uniref:Lipoprotein n=1 Tax=Algoriphagus boseongensis TaxID=1442587 RepID=A0A4R6TCQ1_9BACT|nr:hypothetical protein [Algoriphagus boseongensis]TDQ19224.1 hypothetical protein DFQ04_1043 [Algoriphagus boseongensis]